MQLHLIDEYFLIRPITQFVELHLLTYQFLKVRDILKPLVLDLVQVFLLPQRLTPDTPTIYNSIVNGAHDYLYSPIDNPATLSLNLDPGDFCVITIGVLHTSPSNCAAVPRGAFSSDSVSLYKACDRMENGAMSIDWDKGLGVKLEYYNNRKFIAPEDGCVVIPFAKVSY